MSIFDEISIFILFICKNINHSINTKIQRLIFSFIIKYHIIEKLLLILLMRYCLLFEYDGEKYHGWQVQPDAVTVQQTITKCLCDILNQNISLVGAGRTDTGVHAKFMTAHFDCNFEIEAKDIKQKLNNYLPAEISILKVINVKNNFHARFDAISRTYKYYINQQNAL